ncbi:helix-turn-helix transcriptional regulator [Clostridium sp. YIM B02505]|uniref:Helix-turn-helix transcriptional regulator n=1 Tax=Clostridium yunnanense TaxID=2800325 RepID=A0ABS1EUR8_9CLOT|nr:helix-turn-helix transcriptional regulator [Clostridium yunnanense]MBK1813050.1 helix-turn-helix transcriptional regulator [Clostridium yunnanense]
MDFYSPSEKIRLMRKRFRINQAEIEGVNMTRAFISMMESGKRTVSKASSKALAEKFNEIGKRISVNLDLDDEYFSRQPDEDARFYCEEELHKDNNHKKLEALIKIAKEFKLDDLLARIYKIDGDKYFEEKEYTKAFMSLSNALGKYKELKDDRAQASIYNSMGTCKTRMNEYEEAIFYYKQASSYAHEMGDIAVYSKANYNLSVAYYHIEAYEKSIDTIDKNILSEGRRAIIDDTIRINAKVMRAVSLYDFGKEKDAVQEYFEIIEQIRDNDEVLLSVVYNNLGRYYLKINEFQQSLKYITESQRLKSKVNKQTLPNTLNNKGQVFFKQGFYDESIMLFELAIDIAEEYKQFDMLFENYRDLVKIYESRNDLDKIKASMDRFLSTLDQYDIENGKSYALYKLAEVSAKQGESITSIEYLRKLEPLLIK